MSLRVIGAAGTGLILLTQTAMAFTPPTALPFPQAGSESLLVQARPDPMSAHGAIDWAKERLSEIDATIAALEEDARKLVGDARTRADATLAKLRATRDAYRTEIERVAADSRQKTEAQIAETAAALEKRWTEFEHDLEGYFTTANSEFAARKEVFQARLKAQQLYWQQAIADLKTSAASVAAEQRAAVEKRIADLQVEADAAKARLAKLEQARNEAWSALRQGLADARQAFDKTYDAIRAAMERAKQ